MNKNLLLRAHTTAHTSELIRSGLNAFLTFGDVYRRDEVDAKHYPVFHQCDGARIFIKNELFSTSDDIDAIGQDIPDIFEQENKLPQRTDQKQSVYTQIATDLVEQEMKQVLTSLTQFIFGTCKYVCLIS